MTLRLVGQYAWRSFGNVELYRVLCSNLGLLEDLSIDAYILLCDCCSILEWTMALGEEVSVNCKTMEVPEVHSSNISFDLDTSMISINANKE